MLPHWLRHYNAMGFERERMLMIVHSHEVGAHF